MTSLERFKRATACIKFCRLPDVVPQHLGSGYLADRDVVLTCEHVVRGVGNSETLHIHFMDREVIGKVERRDDQRDLALIRLQAPADDIEPLLMGEQIPPTDAQIAAAGFPHQANALITIQGQIRDPNAKDDLKAPALLIYSDEVAAGRGARLHGMSGGPVVVDRTVIGHLKRVITDDGQAEMGLIYACPSSEINAFLGQPAPRRRLPPPDARFTEEWYVHRFDEEQQALDRIETGDAPTVLFGPWRIGKSWLMHLLLRSQGAHRDSNAWQVCSISLDLLSDPKKTSSTQFLAEFTAQLKYAAQPFLKCPPSIDESLPPRMQVTEMMRGILRATKGTMLLAIERSDRVLGTEVQDDFFSILRFWADAPAYDELYSHLRLLLSISTAPALLIESAPSSPFNADAIRLGDLSMPAIARLAELHRLSWSESDFAPLTDLIGGHPYLLRKAMHYAARHDASIGEICEDADVVFADVLAHQRSRLDADPTLRSLLLRAVEQSLERPAARAFDRLHRRGLAVYDGKNVRLRYRLWERLV